MLYECILLSLGSVQAERKEIHRKIKQDEELSFKEKKQKPYLQSDVSRSWKQPKIAGITFSIRNVILSDEELIKFDAMNPGHTIVIWAGDSAGIPHGVTITLDRNGDERVKGIPTFPLKELTKLRLTRRQLFLSSMPDIVTYDREGIEIKRIRPLRITQTHRFAGWDTRRLELA